MKALSLWQPWASAIAYGLKQHETRGWSTHYRGPLAIHAAARKPTREDIACAPIGTWQRMPYPPVLGAVVAICVLEDVIRCTEAFEESLGPEDRLWGNFAEGRFAWRLRLVERLNPPQPAKGGQGIWLWSPA